MSIPSASATITPTEIPTMDVRDFRNALGAFVTGVTVVTATPEGKPIGFTANSFSSVSLDPPLISICIGKSSSNFDAFSRTDRFNVSILSEEQKDVSKTFSAKGIDRFAQVNWRPGELGAPIIEGASAWFECTLHQRVDAGDHQILIGRVRSFGHNTGSPLGFCRGNYVLFHLGQEVANLSTTKTKVGALLETPEGILMVPDERGILVLPHAQQLGSRKSQDGLYQMLAGLIENFEVDFLYSLWEEKDGGFFNIYYRGTAEGDLRDRNVRVVPLHALKNLETTRDLSIMLKRYINEREDFRYSVYPGLAP